LLTVDNPWTRARTYLDQVEEIAAILADATAPPLASGQDDRYFRMVPMASIAVNENMMPMASP